jgi:hypothetical protein
MIGFTTVAALSPSASEGFGSGRPALLSRRMRFDFMLLVDCLSVFEILRF